MSLEEKVSQMLNSITITVESLDRMNRRLVYAIAVTAICMSLFSGLAVTSLAYLYFRTDYAYGTINQTQGGESNIQKAIEKAGDK